MARNAKAAVKICREKGLKVGLFRPISVYPFPQDRLKELAENTKKFLTVEMNKGQMVRDVRLAVNGKCPVEFFGKAVGQWLSAEDIAQAIEKEIESNVIKSI